MGVYHSDNRIERGNGTRDGHSCGVSLRCRTWSNASPRLLEKCLPGCSSRCSSRCSSWLKEKCSLDADSNKMSPLLYRRVVPKRGDGDEDLVTRWQSASDGNQKAAAFRVPGTMKILAECRRCSERKRKAAKMVCHRPVIGNPITFSNKGRRFDRSHFPKKAVVA